MTRHYSNGTQVVCSDGMIHVVRQDNGTAVLIHDEDKAVPKSSIVGLHEVCRSSPLQPFDRKSFLTSTLNAKTKQHLIDTWHGRVAFSKGWRKERIIAAIVSRMTEGKQVSV